MLDRFLKESGGDSGSLVDGSPEISVAVAVAGGFSLLSLAAVTEALTVANHRLGSPRIGTRIFGLSSPLVQSRSGIQVSVGPETATALGNAAAVGSFDAIFICTGDILSPEEQDAILRLTRCAMRHRMSVHAIGAAIRLLAENGFVSHCTDHWSRIAVLGEVLPRVSVSDAIYHSDRHIITSPGETATLDLVLNLIRDRIGATLAAEVSSHLLMDGARAGSRRQPGSAAHRFRGLPDILTAAIGRIEADIECRPTTQEIAAAVGITARHLERLFSTYMGASPTAYSRRLGLEHGRRLLEQSTLPIDEISLASGFTTVTTFCRHFKRAFGVTPTRYRRG